MNYRLRNLFISLIAVPTPLAIIPAVGLIATSGPDTAPITLCNTGATHLAADVTRWKIFEPKFMRHDQITFVNE